MLRGWILSWALTVSNDGHVTDVLGVIHETTDLSAQSVSIRPANIAKTAVWCRRCVRSTYLLDREAGILLALCSIIVTPRRRLKISPAATDGGGGNLLNHDGGVMDCLLLRKFSSGELSNTPLVARIRRVEGARS